MYYYLEKGALENGSITVIFNTENKIPNYKEITNFGELIEYKGDNIPNNWEFDGEHFYNADDKPSPFHRLNSNLEWVVEDTDKYKKYCFEEIDNIKAKVLEYGFDYEVGEEQHRQRCRDKDIVYMAITALLMFFVKTFLHKDIKKTWYFQDNHGESMDLLKLVQLMFFGGTFVQSVYDTENYFKTLEELKIITYDEFEQKRKEIHKVLANGGD